MDGFKNIEIKHFRGIEHLEIHDFWQTYEGELEKVRIPIKTPPILTIPAKKTKIYAYLEILLGKSKSQKKLIKDANRNYEDTQHWNLDAEYLEPLNKFLKTICYNALYKF